MPDIIIRPCAEGDHAALAALMTELGYPSTTAQMRSRLARIAGRPDLATLVAEADGAVVGFIGLSLDVSWADDRPMCSVASMVVTESARGRGIGIRLVSAAEAWARDRGADRLTLTSHLRRSGAHGFYRALGFEENGKRFAKTLD